MLAQVTSAIYWKRLFGPIHLVCDEQHLATLQEYDAVKYYDSVDTTLLERMPTMDRRYWAFSKIFLAYMLSETDEPFVILDTDLWVRKIPPTFDPTADIVAFHQEAFDVEYEHNMYLEPKHFIEGADDLGLDWSVLPVNCAFVYFNNATLVTQWYFTCLEIIRQNRDKPAKGGALDMVFIEQRLLPTLAEKMGLRVEVIIPSVYLSQVPHFSAQDVGQWSPPLASAPNIEAAVACVSHIWGMKKFFKNEDLREIVIMMLMGDLQDILAPKYGDISRKLLIEVRDLLPAKYLPSNQPTP